MGLDRVRRYIVHTFL